MNQPETKKRHPRLQDLTGMTFGRLTVEAMADSVKKVTRWSCVCECGARKTVRAGDLKRGLTTSCGCRRREVTGLKKTTHGHGHSRTNRVWQGMLQRCGNPRNKSYPRYGGRGIKVCDRWKTSFVAFLEDMGERPSDRHEIDRINNDGDYCPENCRWLPQELNLRNTSRNRFLEFKGESRCIAEWAGIVGIDYHVLYQRLERGWSVEEALTP